MAGNIPKEHGHSPDDTSGLIQPHVPETGRQSPIESSGGKQSAVAEARESTVKSEDLCKKKLKITEIDIDVFMKICGLLNMIHVLGGDYRTLAGKLGYNVIDADMFKQEGNATKSLLFHWSQRSEGNTAEKILNILIKMERDDIVQLLNKEFENCNCQNCASLC